MALLDRGRYRSIEIRTVDGRPVRDVPHVLETLKQWQWVDSYKGLIRRK